LKNRQPGKDSLAQGNQTHFYRYEKLSPYLPFNETTHDKVFACEKDVLCYVLVDCVFSVCLSAAERQFV
jgi:hypothetical protein